MAGERTWYYLDDDGKEQGPWSTQQLLHWLTRNVLPLTTPLKSSADGQFVPVGDHPDLQQEPPQQPPQQPPPQRQAPPPQQPQFGGDPWRRGDVPRNPALVDTIEKLAAAVRKVGPQMENTVRQRNPEFAFLFGGEGAAFYQATLAGRRVDEARLHDLLTQRDNARRAGDLRAAEAILQDVRRLGVRVDDSMRAWFFELGGGGPGPGGPPGHGGPPGPGGVPPGPQGGRMGGPGMGGPAGGGFKRERQW